MGSILLTFEKAEIESSIPIRFEKIVEQYPNRTAIKTSDACWNYATLNERANQLAWMLLENFGSNSEPVTFLLESPEKQIMAMLGIQKAGKLYLPLDRHLPQARLATMVEDSQARTIVTDGSNEPLAKDLAIGNPSLIDVDVLEPGPSKGNPGLEISPDTPVYILYTSGSAGRPKGVVQNHRNLLQSIWGATQNYRIIPQDRFGLLTSTGFAASNGPVYGSLLNGASVYPYDMQRGLADLPRWIETEEITVLLMVPSIFRHLALSLTGKETFSNLRLIVLMGETVTRTHIDLYRQYFPSTCLLRNSYAATEMHTVCSLTIDHQTEFEGSMVPVGKAVPGKEILLMNDTGDLVGAGQEGEIVIRSRYLSSGYWRRPDLNASQFKQDPADGDRRLYFTGDLGRMSPDGCLTHLGRKDFMVKIRGYRVELGEIEVALAQHPDIKECAVAVQENEVQEKRLIGYYVSSRNHGAIPPEELRIFLRRRIPDYMVPFAFVSLAYLPVTPTGKLDRRALPELEEVFNLEKDYVAPRNKVESQLVQLWEELLEVSPIGIKTDFFQIGGHSLLAARMVADVEKIFGRQLNLGMLAQATTIAELAAVLHQGEVDGEAKSLVAIRASGRKPPLYCVHGVGGHILPFLDLAKHLWDEQPVYGLQAKPARIEDGLTIESLAKEYIEEIERFQPEGPYFLAGFSFGGFVAYEMARQLEAKGEKVAILALFDTQASSLQGFRESLSRIGYIRYRVRAFMERTLFRLSEMELTSKILKQDGKEEATNLKETILGDIDIDTVPGHLRDIMAANQMALSEYIPGRYNGLITLFKSSYYGRGVYYGWRELSSGGIEIFEIPGTHRGMMQEPNVRILADYLRQCIAMHLEDDKK